MILFKYYALAFLLFVKAKSFYAMRSFDVRWRHINCTIMSKTYFGFFNCTLNDFPKNRGNYATAYIQFNQDIRKVSLDLRVSMPNSNNKDKDFIKFKTDGCHISKHKSTNPVISAVTKQLYQLANFPDSCPLKANFTYTVNNFSLNPDYFPGYTPEMNFSIKFSMYTGKVHLLASNLMASIVKKK